jgi:hypothetical protein
VLRRSAEELPSLRARAQDAERRLADAEQTLADARAVNVQMQGWVIKPLITICSYFQ